ncbi:MAG: excinuclease ABC subunit UvrB [Candidatus Kerfeldbacteria bacterium]|nr:excinuclease ABC subunit UvrB [Candidatus Kerfeldbacteria bacterium]
MPAFKLHSPFNPTGDQPQAIARLIEGLKRGNTAQTLLGVTGSGKTFTMANVVAAVNRPTLVISHNKTLAAQLASEFKEFFPENAVHYFVSYYDYYQPEAYIPRTDTYIEKETNINEEIDRLRNAATRDLLTRPDVLIVASVSCIYGLGNPTEYQKTALTLTVGQRTKRQSILIKLNRLLYLRNDVDFHRSTYRVRGDTLDIYPAYEERGVRISFFGDNIEGITIFDPITGQELETLKSIEIFPGRHFVTPTERLPHIAAAIRAELAEQLAELKHHGKLLEGQRLEQRTNFDLEMIETVGYCNGIENYSRFFDGRQPGQPPSTLLDYFPKNFLLFIDESHMSLPQIRGMYEGDRSRKQVLVGYGFRLPSALDNRPLRFDEFKQRIGQRIYVSATPEEAEIRESTPVVEQFVRPTGLLDPTIEVLPTKGQVDHLLEAIKQRVKQKQRVLITTLTKRMAEELTDYLKELGIKVQYLHADVETFARLEILRDLRLGVYDVVVGINLLREGLDLPEVSLVAILDADKEGYLRSKTALLQTMGRAARHVDGHVIMYADTITGSMKNAIAEVERRRKIQQVYNQQHHVTPTSIAKAVRQDRLAGLKLVEEQTPKLLIDEIPAMEINHVIADLTNQMKLASQNLEFEKAAILRDQIAALKQRQSIKPAGRKRSTRRPLPRPFGKRKRA